MSARAAIGLNSITGNHTAHVALEVFDTRWRATLWPDDLD